MSAKSDHRAGVFERARREDELGMVRCYVRRFAVGAGSCGGVLQAAHYIGCSELRNQRQKMVVSGHRFAPDDPRRNLTTVTLDDLWRDPRNGLVLCLDHHELFDGKRPPRRLHLTPPPSVIDFANEYGLRHLVEPTYDERRAV